MEFLIKIVTTTWHTSGLVMAGIATQSSRHDRGQGVMKSCLRRVLLATVVTCGLSLLVFTLGYGLMVHSFDGDSHGARQEAFSPVDNRYRASLLPGPQQAVLDRGQPGSRRQTSAEVSGALRLTELSASPATPAKEQSPRLLAMGREDAAETLFRPSTILMFLLILLALVSLRRNPTDRS